MVSNEAVLGTMQSLPGTNL